MYHDLCVWEQCTGGVLLLDWLAEQVNGGGGWVKWMTECLVPCALYTGTIDVAN